MIEDGQGEGNHPLALRMGIVAFLSYNIGVSAVFGTFSVMLAAVVERLHVSIEVAALAMPAAIVGNALTASAAGVLMARYPLRLMFLAGAIMCATAFALLATFESFAVYIAVYGLLLGPGVAMIGTIGPATLVTRWFTHRRGLALGLVHLPLIYAFVPIASNWSYEHHGASTTYLAIATAIVLVVIPAVSLVQEPPVAETTAAAVTGKEAPGALTMRQLLSRPRYWMLAFAGASVAGGSTAIGAALVPMAASWGIDRADAAILASTTSGVGMAGSVLFGWIADRLGGERGLAIMTFGCIVLCSAMILHPPFPVLLCVIGMFGMCGAGTVSNLSRAIADNFGAANFSRALGLYSTLSLPVTVLLVPALPAINSFTGSYSPALGVLIAVYSIGFFCALAVSLRRGNARVIRILFRKT
jgi:MFS family permease